MLLVPAFIAVLTSISEPCLDRSCIVGSFPPLLRDRDTADDVTPGGEPLAELNKNGTTLLPGQKRPHRYRMYCCGPAVEQTRMVVVGMGIVGFFWFRAIHLTLTKRNVAPENGWLEDDRFLLGWLPGRCELLVSRRVYVG